MKINTKAKVSLTALMLMANVMPVYATNVITASNLNVINQNSISIISSKNGETVSQIEGLEDAFKISFTNENYVTTKFAKVTSGKNGLSQIPVYKEASTSSQEVGKIAVDSTVVLGEEKNGFSQIFFEENIGYIENTYLIDSKPEQEKIEEEQSVQTQKYARIDAVPGLNLREQPTTSSTSLAVIPSDEYVDFLEDNGEWLKVKYNNQIGYISAQYAEITDKKEQVVSNASPKAQEIINFAKAHIGKPYIYGSINLETGTDCSGFTYSVFKKFGINLNRVSRDQYQNGTAVDKKNLMPGDLVFFNTGGNSPISHVGIYIGNNQYIHCTDTNNKGVMISSLNDAYSLKNYYGARRVIPE